MAAGKQSSTKSTASKQSASARKVTKSAAKQATATTTSNSKKVPAKKAPAKKVPAKKAPAKKAPAKKVPAKKVPAKKVPAKKATGRKAAAHSNSTTPTKAMRTKKMTTGSYTSQTAAAALPKPRFNKEGLGYTKDFDLTFVKEQHDALQAERVRLTGQAMRLEAEAQQLVQEAEMGDVRFDDEGGEGDSTNVERERDLALSAQARDAVDEIDAALLRIMAGTYGYSVMSGRPIPRERLEAIPWSSVLVEEKVGGIGRR